MGRAGADSCQVAVKKECSQAKDRLNKKAGFPTRLALKALDLPFT
jgi:hypothetical protein